MLGHAQRPVEFAGLGRQGRKLQPWLNKRHKREEARDNVLLFDNPLKPDERNNLQRTRKPRGCK